MGKVRYFTGNSIGCEVHTIRVGMAPPLQAEWSQRNRVSGVSRSCKTDAGMLVASAFARRQICAGAFGNQSMRAQRRETPVTVGEPILHLMSRSNQLCRTVSYSRSTHTSMAKTRSSACGVARHMLCSLLVQAFGSCAEQADRPFGSLIRRCSARRTLWNRCPRPLALAPSVHVLTY